MTEHFLKLVDMSLSAGWMVLAVLASRLVLKKAPRWMVCGLWALVAVRLLCPFSLESNLSLVPEMETVSQEILSTPAAYPLPGALTAADSTPVPAEGNWEMSEGESYFYATAQKPDGTEEIVGPMDAAEVELSWLDICAGVWPLGILVMTAYALFSYLHIRRKVRISMELQKGIHICDEIGSPFILGVVKPKIYLPSDMDPKDIAHVLAHEQAHLTRRDHWWKPLGYLLLTIHWFNPLLWLAYILLCRDIELACDERVVKKLAPPQRKAYSEALLNCSLPRKRIAACPLAFGEVGIKQRVKSVLSYRKPGFWILLASAIAILTVSVCFLTDPRQNTLSKLCSIDREAVTCIDLRNSDAMACVSWPEDLEAVWDYLEKAKYAPQPHDTTENFDIANRWEYYELEFNLGEELHLLCFYPDFSSVCWQDAEGTLQHYTLDDPAAAEALMERFIDPVSRWEAMAQPFASVSDPALWLQGISEDAVRSARMRQYESHVISGSYLPTARFQELLDILHDIPADALSNQEVIVSSSNDRLDYVAAGGPNIYIAIEDKANALAVFLRYFQRNGSHLQLVITDDMRTLRSTSCNNRPRAYKWDINSPELLTYLQKLAQYYPGVSTFQGYWMDIAEESIDLTNGEAELSLLHIRDWTYEITEPEEGVESFGIRVRPPGETSGWLYFSVWPGGYNPKESGRFYNDTLYSVNERTYIGYSSHAKPSFTDIWSYQKWCTNIGDYAIINEDADHWIKTHSEEVHILLNLYFSFRNGEPVDIEIPKSTETIVYTQSKNLRRGMNNVLFDLPDKAHMTLGRGWLYDNTPVMEEDHIQLASIWPEYETEGKVVLEYWEGFFQPDSTMTVREAINPDVDSTYPCFTGTLPGEEDWTYFWTDLEHGSYVFRCEDTESWSGFDYNEDRRMNYLRTLIETLTFDN